MKKTDKQLLFERMEIVNPDFKTPNEIVEIFTGEKMSPEMEKEIASHIPSIAANYQNRIDDDPIRTIITVLWENYNYRYKNVDLSAMSIFVNDWIKKNMPDLQTNYYNYKNM